MLTRIFWRGAALTWLLCPGIGGTAAGAAGNVDAARLQAADSEPQNWFTGGRDKDGTYFSPLTAIDAGNVKQLGFAWSYDLGDPQRGQEATPLVIDGVMYTSGTWGYVYAVDAASGKELWRYDPKADSFMGRNPCCDLVNRGVAVWKGKVFVASVDGRLHALDAATGKKLWEADTIVDRKLPYSSTGAPQIAGSVVVIGNSGADMGHGAVRGYISAYDLESGALKWRFFTVPPAVGQPYENPELAAADKTWDPQRKPEFKGGATAWDGFAYDAKLNLLYFGTANAAPYDLRQLGPKQLDSLYATCIIALDATTRAHGVVLPGNAARQLGLRCGPKDGAGGHHDRWPAPLRHHAGFQERLLLCAGSQDREIAVGQELRVHELGDSRGHEDRQARDDPAIGLVQHGQAHLPLLVWRSHLESDVIQSAHAAGLHSRDRRSHDLGRPAAQRQQSEICRGVLYGAGHYSRRHLRRQGFNALVRSGAG